MRRARKKIGPPDIALGHFCAIHMWKYDLFLQNVAVANTYLKVMNFCRIVYL